MQAFQLSACIARLARPRNLTPPCVRFLLRVLKACSAFITALTHPKVGRASDADLTEIRSDVSSSLACFADCTQVTVSSVCNNLVDGENEAEPNHGCWPHCLTMDCAPRTSSSRTQPQSFKPETMVYAVLSSVCCRLCEPMQYSTMGEKRSVPRPLSKILVRSTCRCLPSPSL
ncbi:hypothetical protein DFH06DRAFT_400923 [Mycena polygramma]|nr:hypothetical protein DFH06DRAFT_400923 [Mycena polygramma]